MSVVGAVLYFNKSVEEEEIVTHWKQQFSFSIDDKVYFEHEGKSAFVPLSAADMMKVFSSIPTTLQLSKDEVSKQLEYNFY